MISTLVDKTVVLFNYENGGITPLTVNLGFRSKLLLSFTLRPFFAGGRNSGTYWVGESVDEAMVVMRIAPPGN